jgi:hypothetical protein
MNNKTPARANVVVLKQLLNLIPRGLINRHARETGVEAKARSFSVVSHLAAMLFAQLTHSIGLNDLCDWLRLKSGVLSRFGVTPPARNTLSHANKERSADFMERLFWAELAHLQHASPDFATGRKGKGLLQRFKVKSTQWIRQPCSWWPTAWTGRSTAGARLPPRCICASICTASCHLLPSWIPQGSMTTSVPARSALALQPGKSRFLTRLTLIFPILPSLTPVGCTGSREPRTR